MKKQLARVRNQIDALDREIVERLNTRLKCAQQIGEIKRGAKTRIYVAEREADVLRRVSAANRGPLKPAALQAIYREIMSAALALEKPLCVAYLGPEATNTHAAALRKFGSSVDYRPMATIADIFTAVEKGEADYGVVPVENSTEGAVRDSLDLFVETPLKIVAELHQEIEHTLLSRSPLAKIKKVYSKDQALAQCRRWLQRNLPHARLVDVDSTALGVQVAAREKGAAAIAPRLAGERYGVPVAATHIQDLKNNTSRFVFLGREASGSAGSGHDKTSLLVSLHHEPGALLHALQPFNRRKLNLTRIESRPSRLKPWDYIFFLDVKGHYEDPPMQAALKELSRKCPLVKWLGSYPVAKK
ncbi:MAG TPA: prephenate dehydratase [Lacunisphaera sp.]|jgi:chorismate mutase/prephenate dehydratase|nr:prephenate dehydratase [Lacunisphaera sp.]